LSDRKFSGPHRRYNPLLDEWVLVSPHRLERPWQGQIDAAADEPLPSYDPGCYLCPGNERAGGHKNPEYGGTFAFTNDFSALLPDTRDPDVRDDLFVATPERGICRVVCFSPRHDLTLARMERPAIRTVVDLWADESAALAARENIGHVQVFENKGAMMGCSNPHPHGQIWATDHVPTLPGRKAATQRAYHASHDADMLGDYLARELERGDRIVCANESWAALVPFWAVWPFETLALPRRHVTDLLSLVSEERDGLADILKRVTVRYDNLFGCSFPYSMGVHQRPVDGRDHPYWRLHLTFLPPLLRSCTIRKFLVGYELAAEPQRDLTAEDAAARLRAASETHYGEEPHR
jgi:UDPglucose--hexose-1-phosphate uridylyltransferase